MPDYPAKSYQRLYDPGLEPLWDLASGLAPKEDGAHRSSEAAFFEWWYFDAALDSGERLVIIFHSAVFNLTARPAAVDIRLTARDREPLINFKVYASEQCQTSKSHCDVQIADCRVTAENAQKYVIQIRQGEISADLIYESQLPGWKPGTGYLFHDAASGHFFKWIVPQPFAKVSGSVQIGQQKLNAEGIGYHDHNWGNIHLNEAFSHWHWGRFISADQRSAFVFGDVVSKGYDPVHVKPVLLVANGVIQTPQEILVEYPELRSDEISGVSYSKRIHISGKGLDFDFDFLMTTRETLEALTFASPLFRQRKLRIAAEILYYLTFTKPLIGRLSKKLISSASYLRFQAQGNLQIKHPLRMNQMGETIYEIMSFD